MKEAFSLLVLGMLIILGISAVVGAIMFVIDIWKWSKRPEKFKSFEEDLKDNNDVTVKEVIHNERVS